MAVVELTQDQIDAGLHAPGANLVNGQFTYSIANAASTWANYLGGTQPFSNYSLLSTAQADAFRMAIGAWDSLIAPNFTEVTDTATTSGEIRVAFTSYQMDAGTAAYAFLPTQHVIGSKDGDVWVNSNSTASNFSIGTDLYVAFLHELGHTLGLKHSFESPVIPAPYDTTRYTVMSYTSATPAFSIGFTGSGNSISTTSQRVVATTPEVLDIAAVQKIYGADPNTASGATTYTFSQTDTSIKSVYDAGGVDTFDLSSFTHQVLLDLTPGSYSSIGFWSKADQIAYWQGQYPQFSQFIADTMNSNNPYTWQNNVGISFSTVIENAKGGSANDTINGNAVDNQLFGGGGNDVLIGNGGNDTLDGQAGTDSLYGGIGDDTYFTDVQGDLVFEDSGGGTDTVNSTANFYLYANVENLNLVAGAGNIFGVGNGLANAINGNEGNNTLLAGAGVDVVHGGAGVDIIYGEDGNDQLFGDADNDFLAGGLGDDVMDGGTGGDSLYGEDGNDTLTGGTDFVFDQLVGGNGNDVLHGDSGMADYDYLYGNAGDDSFYVDTGDDLTFEQAGEGIDTVYANVPGSNNGVYLYANIENLVLLGTTSFGVGNVLANVMTGNASGNYLLGGDGNDRLNGKAGNDVLFGQAGADTFVFEHGTGGDVIGDFIAGTDKIDLSAIGYSWAQVQNSFHQNGGNTAIDLGGGDLVVLNGVTIAQLSQSDFVLSVGGSLPAPVADQPGDAGALAFGAFLPLPHGDVTDFLITSFFRNFSHVE